MRGALGDPKRCTCSPIPSRWLLQAAGGPKVPSEHHAPPRVPLHPRMRHPAPVSCPAPLAGTPSPILQRQPMASPAARCGARARNRVSSSATVLATSMVPAQGLLLCPALCRPPWCLGLQMGPRGDLSSPRHPLPLLFQKFRGCSEKALPRYGGISGVVYFGWKEPRGGATTSAFCGRAVGRLKGTEMCPGKGMETARAGAGAGVGPLVANRGGGSRPAWVPCMAPSPRVSSKRAPPEPEPSDLGQGHGVKQGST